MYEEIFCKKCGDDCEVQIWTEQYHSGLCNCCYDELED